MKKFNKIFLSLLFIAGLNFSQAQTAAKKSADDSGKISLTAFVPEQTEKIPDGAAGMLTNKINQILSQNGMGSSAYNSRFIITANIVVLTKDLTATAPPMTAMTLEVTLVIGDGFEGRKFASHTVTVKGVGTNENKGYMEAIKLINPKNPEIQSFVASGKSKIIEYYNSNCANIIKQAKALEQQNKLDEAIYMLTSVPDASADCFNKAMAAAEPLYKKQIDKECKTRLMEATTLWNANQTVDAANQAGELLSAIDPQSSCFGEVKVLSAKIGKRVQEIDKREWKYKVDSEIGLEKDRIKAIRDIGVAYGNGQPKTVNYNVRGWW
ncbi:hypothetical protein FNO01nite_03460 [Flavobacterium noncentrifugens]|uniref:Tetratricopeptide repeat-containing protein n=1 Tax=Flavobacterium noncentrifugens TaxID=1128970 RepID=A0A1G8S2T1_9FLAO|nr:hypothetical protein [Flavobacterium noncentrifugens]GEP49674.1 hypothetical protein FNO01nite_03460 [Flavobacterium noncentrifugens]SDJ23548.1 hypothetical protein SAMN04487935_0382 [Flavobacterium noncentrifugens]